MEFEDDLTKTTTLARCSIFFTYILKKKKKKKKKTKKTQSDIELVF